MSEAASPASLIPDMAWCWWTRPRATRIGGAVFFAGLDSGGGMVVAKHDLATRATERARLAAFEDDDHNNPAVIARAGQPLLCFYSRHDAEEGLRYRISRRPLDVGAWEPEQILTFGGPTTYAQVHEVADELHLFTRVDETRWGWRLSRDWARSWEAPRDFLSFDTDQQVYMATALLGDGRTLRVGVSGHPKDYTQRALHDVWACEVDLLTGAVRKPSSGEVIGNLRTGERLPLRETMLELAQRTPADRTVNVLDVSSGPVFEIGFVSKVRNDLTTEDARYHVAALRHGNWSTEDVAAAGRKFGYIDAGLYVGGVAFPERAAAGQVYLTREAAGLWHFEFWRRGADGTWRGEPVVPPSPIRMTRPWAVYPPDDRLGVVALALERYADDSYYGSLSHLIGAPLPKDFAS
jgi:hypothetical protein